MNLIRIDDPDDPRIAGYRDIRERDLAGRQGLFVAEGKVVLNVLFQAKRFEAQSALVLDNRLAGLGDTLRDAPGEMPVYVASRPVMDEIAGFPIHRGILALGRRRFLDRPQDMLTALPERATVLMLVGISNHDNMGALFRNAAAFGVGAVFLDATCCDPLYRKAIRVSVGAALKVPFVLGLDVGDANALLDENGFGALALSPAGRTDIRAVERPKRLALWIGAEGDGLPQPILDRLPTARIRMAPGFDSLNVAVASAIALHELSD